MTIKNRTSHINTAIVTVQNELINFVNISQTVINNFDNLFQKMDAPQTKYDTELAEEYGKLCGQHAMAVNILKIITGELEEIKLTESLNAIKAEVEG